MFLMLSNHSRYSSSGSRHLNLKIHDKLTMAKEKEMFIILTQSNFKSSLFQKCKSMVQNLANIAKLYMKCDPCSRKTK